MTYYKIGAILFLLLFTQCHPKDDGLWLEGDENGVITKINDSHSEINWMLSQYPVYSFEENKALKPELYIEKKSDETYQLKLTLINIDSKPIIAEPIFPRLREWKFADVNPKDVYQLFPRQGEMANNADSLSYEEVYSGNFPFQFFDLSNGEKGGLMFQVLDESNYPKKFYYNRLASQFDFGVIHRAKELAPGERWELPVVEISSHSGDWHAAFYRYRNWLKKVLNPVTERKEWFRDVYNFRQTFLYDNGGEIGAYNLKTKKIDLESKINESIEAFGGVDYLHLFDWGMTPEYGRCGDYNPWYYVDKQKLQSQIQKIKSRNIPVGLYHEGYLLSPNSNVCKAHGAEWQMLDRNLKRYERFGSGYYYPCPSLSEWREYLASTVQRSSEELEANGVYIDQFGFGWQYGCFNPEHDHDTNHTSIDSELQVSAEAGLMNAIKKKLPDSIVTYTEECPTDISTQYQDGSFTYAISIGRDSSRHNPAVVNLARFAFPDYKLIEILHVDNPVGNDIDGVKHVFFNGEGIWLSGPLSNPKWFPETLRSVIRKCYPILREHRDAFRSLEPQPLVKTMDSSIKANYFPTEKKRVWTFYNISHQNWDDDVIEIEAIEGARYYDEWNKQDIYPVIKGDKAIIRLSIAAKDVGCLVQYLPF